MSDPSNDFNVEPKNIESPETVEEGFRKLAYFKEWGKLASSEEMVGNAELLLPLLQTMAFLMHRQGVSARDGDPFSEGQKEFLKQTKLSLLFGKNLEKANPVFRAAMLNQFDKWMNTLPVFGDSTVGLPVFSSYRPSRAFAEAVRGQSLLSEDVRGIIKEAYCTGL